MDDRLASLASCSHLLAELVNRPTIVRSTIKVWSDDFAACLITSYGYEVYRAENRLYWYDDFPHPEIPTLAPTFPHHKHIQPDIRHNRVPAPGLSFATPNLSILIAEVESLSC